MATIWIGDFRCRQLQQYHKTASNIADNIYLLEDHGEYSWFNTGLLEQLPQLSLEEANVVIMLGFNDCIYSCAWNAFNIRNIAADYIKVVNELVDNYPSVKFYLCSVNPVDADYSFAEYSTDGIISKNTLIEKIKLFNSIIKNSGIKATFIDTYEYLTTTSFYTHDGVLFDTATLRSIDEYISLYVTSNTGTLFIPRLVAPVVDIEASGEYWLGENYGGANPFYNLGQSYAKIEGDTLPNCTAYAWGRFYEILGSKPTLSTENAEQWYLNIGDGYTRGQDPALGAIMCWQAGTTTNINGNDGVGHVAIVEQINPDGSIVTSESGWNDARYWWTTTREKGINGNWGASSDYTFQGFIYCPLTSSISEENLCVKNSYGISIDEMKPNAQYIWQYFGSRGWTMNAVAGLLGNLQQESKMSPAIWESIIDGSIIKPDGTQELNMSAINNYYASKGRYPGYGLVQWTPYSKYTDWCKSNKLSYWKMDSQLQRIIYEAEQKIQWSARPSKGYDLSFSEFISSTKEAYWLAGAFAFCYERPARSSGSAAEQDALRKERGEYGEYWYNFLKSLPPVTADTSIHLADIKIFNRLSTSISVSFLARNAKNANYILDKKASIEVPITGDLVAFNINNLVPNKEYKLTLNVFGDTTLSETITFTTEQDYPDAFDKIELARKIVKFPNDSFELSTLPKSVNFGYWKKNGNYGYIIQLIVNGKVKREKEVSVIPTNFSLSEYFGYNVKANDIIQIGIRTKVICDNKNLYDSDFVKASNSVCMLTKSVTAYINKQ